MSSELQDALLLLEKEKGISRDVIVEAIEAALVSAYRLISFKDNSSPDIIFRARLANPSNDAH